MRQSIVPVIAAISLIALPAFAATTTSESNRSTSSSRNMAAQTAGRTQQDPDQFRQNLSKDLTQAGYTDIQIMPGSFLVHAKDKQGHPTEMMISPNSILEVSTIARANSNIKTSSNTTGTMGAGGATGNSSNGQVSK